MSSDLTTTRIGLHQLAVHVLARRRFGMTGRFGLRPTPGGLGTPAFGGDELEVVRTSGGYLVVERGGTVTAAPITTLAAAADLVGVDLAADFSAGPATPPQAGPDQPLSVVDTHARTIAAWWAFGQTVLDVVIATADIEAQGAVVQMWPEHLDVAGVIERGGEHLNVGASPGDASVPTPYLYLGPWSSERPGRPGRPGYWNVSFGAILRSTDIDHLTPPERRRRALAFFAEGLSRY